MKKKALLLIKTAGQTVFVQVSPSDAGGCNNWFEPSIAHSLESPSEQQKR